MFLIIQYNNSANRMKRYTFIYTNPIPQSPDINLLYNTALSLSRRAKTIYLYHPQFFHSHPTQYIFNPHNFIKNLLQLHSILFSNFTDINFYDITSIKKINRRLINLQKNIIIFLIKKQPNRVLMSLYPNDTLINFQKLFQPRLTIGDCLDYWELEQLKFSQKLDLIFTNSTPLYRTCQKNSKKCFLIPAGYYYQKPILALFRHNFFSATSKNILFIGTVNWKYNLDIVKKTITSLPDHTFHFYCFEIFDFDKTFNNPDLNKKVAIAQKKWHQIKQLPNVQIHLSKSEVDLPHIKLKFRAAIIPTRTDYPYGLHCHPIKYYMYQAMRLPIISTNLLCLHNKCYTSDNASEWVKYIQSIKNNNSINRSAILFQSHESKAKIICQIVSKILS